MSQVRKLQASEDFPPARLRLFRPIDSQSHSVHWRINGYPATLQVWTEEQWRRLEDRPSDAQHLSCGMWCALRIDPV